MLRLLVSAAALGLAAGCSLVELTNGQTSGAGGAGGAGQGGGAGSTSTAMGGAGGDIGQGGGGGGGTWAGGRCANGPPGSAIEWSCGFGNSTDQGTGESAVRVAAGTERLFVAASTVGALDLGDGPLGEDGSGNVIVAGLSPQGIVAWSHAVAGSAAQKIVGNIAVSPTGRVAVVGRFQYGAIDVGAASVTARAQDSFLFVYDGNGALVDARIFRDIDGAASNREQRALTVAFDAADSIFVGGEVRDTLEVVDLMGAVDPDCRKTTTSTGREALVLKLSSSLDCEWYRTFGAGSDDGITAMAVGPSGEVFAGGYFRGTVNVDMNTQIISATTYADDGMLVAFSPAGATLWAKRFGSSNTDRVHALTAGTDGIFLSGYHGGGFTMLECTPAVPYAGGRDALIARLGFDGACTWVRAVRSIQDDEALAVASLGGSPIFGGYFRDMLQDDPVATPVGGTDGMVAPLDGATGTPDALLRLGSLGTDMVQALAPSADGGAIYVGGTYGGPISELPIPQPLQPQDFFLARVRVGF